MVVGLSQTLMVLQMLRSIRRAAIRQTNSVAPDQCAHRHAFASSRFFRCRASNKHSPLRPPAQSYQSPSDGPPTTAGKTHRKIPLAEKRKLEIACAFRSGPTTSGISPMSRPACAIPRSAVVRSGAHLLIAASVWRRQIRLRQPRRVSAANPPSSVADSVYPARYDSQRSVLSDSTLTRNPPELSRRTKSPRFKWVGLTVANRDLPWPKRGAFNRRWYRLPRQSPRFCTASTSCAGLLLRLAPN